VIVLQTSAASSPPIRENLPETSRGALLLSDLRESRVNRRDSLRNFILGLFTYYAHKNSFAILGRLSISLLICYERCSLKKYLPNVLKYMMINKSKPFAQYYIFLSP